jgi:hypothetical protein
MANTDTLRPNINYSFLLWWTLANIVALPILLIPQGMGELLLGMFSVMTDGMSIGVIGYLFALIILSVSGLFVGAWLGFWQWLVIRKQLPKAGKWIFRSAIGVAVGAPLSWLIYGAIFVSPIANRSDGFYFSFWYGYMAFGIILGLSVGISQWHVLRQWSDKAGWWIVALPICFTLGMASTDPFIAPGILKIIIPPLVERIAAQYPNELMNYDLLLIAIVDSIIALIGIGLVTSFLLDWLLRFHRRQTSEEAVKGS